MDTAAAGASAGAIPSSATPPGADVYTRLGVRHVINGMGTVTTMGGSLMPPEVVRAMAAAAGHFVSLPDLQLRVGARIAGLLGAPAAMVTAGATSAITVATAACVTRGDGAAVHRLPDTAGLRNEVVIQSAHRSGYEPQMNLVGVKLVWVETRKEVDRAINDRTAMMFFLNKADPSGQVRLGEWVKVGRERGVPTFNAAAADLPPASRLASYVEEGFDLVAFSGG
jgi:L-seryl-tRNA(Ser) seleniumtransferase